jgi:hypothetical protein
VSVCNRGVFLPALCVVSHGQLHASPRRRQHRPYVLAGVVRLSTGRSEYDYNTNAVNRGLLKTGYKRTAVTNYINEKKNPKQIIMKMLPLISESHNAPSSI